MDIWEVTIKDEEYFGTRETYLGLATKAQQAIDKALKLAQKEYSDHKRLYVSTAKCLGTKEFG